MTNIIFPQDNLDKAFYMVRQLQAKVSLVCFSLLVSKALLLGTSKQK